MTDQTIPADKVRPILDEWEQIKKYADWEDMNNLVQAIRDLLPPRPTLADMTWEERAACQWMQADITGGEVTEPLVIARLDRDDGSALILDRNGRSDWAPAEHVTPRPDLPCLEWPGEQQPAPAPALPDGWRLADHKDYGRVIVTNPTPESDGYVAFVRRSDYLNSGHGNDWCKPAELTYIDQEADQ